jgi:outer membrane protein assembly factor BamA
VIGFTVSGLLQGTLSANEHLFGNPIAEIRVQGNRKTRSDLVIVWSELKIGQILSRDILNLARQNILDIELFKQVSVEAESDDGQVIVNISLEEKRFTLVLPTLRRNADGDVKTGVRVKIHNLNGANQTLSALVEKADIATGETGERYRVSYELPQYSKPYEYKFSISQSTTHTEDAGFSNVEYEDLFSVSIKRDWHTSISPQPLTLTVSAIYQDVDLREPYPPALNELEAGRFNRLGLRIEFDDIHYEKYRRYGRYYSLTYQQGLTNLGSDYTSNITELDARHYYRLNSLDNFNSRVFAGYAHNAPFDQPYYDIGSSDTLRGLDRDSFSGDVLVFANLEYIKGFAKYRTFRTSLFIDIGNVYDDLNGVDFSDLRTSIGLGIRWKIVSFVQTDLIIDWAYDTETGENRAYGSTSFNF